MSVFETKSVRVHLEDRGQYVYLLLTCFDGRNHLLADEGWRDEYIRYGIISRGADREDAVTGDPFALVRQNEWLRETPAERLIKDIDMGRIEWADLDDGDRLDATTVKQLRQTTEANR
jgi:hypothetical protein